MIAETWEVQDTTKRFSLLDPINRKEHALKLNQLGKKENCHLPLQHLQKSLNLSRYWAGNQCGFHQNRSNIGRFMNARNQSSSSILNSLQLIQYPISQTITLSITIVNVKENKTVNQLFKQFFFFYIFSFY